MIHEMGAARLNSLMMSLYDIYPDLKDWDYKDRYKLIKWNTSESERKEELGKITRFIVSYLEFGLSVKDPFFKKLVMYYLVVLDSLKYNLDFEYAKEDIFEEAKR